MNTNKTMNSVIKSVYCELNFPLLPTISVDERFKAAFDSPVAIHVATVIEEVKTVLANVEAARLRGHWCVGFVAHEAAGAFDDALVVKAVTRQPTPLAWFAEFTKPASAMDEASEASDAFTVGEWQRDTDAAQFARAVESIRADIHEGRFYQVNFTTRLETTFVGDARQFFRALQVAQPKGYHLFIDAGDFQLLSVSPELFFSTRNNVITTQPMKGTAPRGDTPSEDAAIAETLTHSPKERAENLMIVDLLRNDLSRIATPIAWKCRIYSHCIRCLPFGK